MSNSRQKGTQVELMELLMNKTKKGNSVHLLQMEKHAGEEHKIDSGWFFLVLERVGAPSL